MRTKSARSRGARELAAAGLKGVLLTGVSLLAACGFFGGSHSAPGVHAAPQAHAAPSDPNAKLLAGMVAAVGPSRGQPPVELRFAIRQRPAVGEEDQIDYALIPQVPGLGTVRLVFGSPHGLQVVSQDPPSAPVEATSGVPILGSVTVRPLQTGLFTVTAEVAIARSTTHSVIWPFSIPVLVGEGPAETAANPP